MTQIAIITAPSPYRASRYAGNRKFKIRCYRGDALLCNLEAGTEAGADLLKRSWDSGYTQAGIAELMKSKGWKI